MKKKLEKKELPLTGTQEEPISRERSVESVPSTARSTQKIKKSQSRCSTCPRNKDQKTTQTRDKCKAPSCKLCSAVLCKNCYKN